MLKNRFIRASVGAAALALTVMGSTAAMATTYIFSSSGYNSASLHVNGSTSIDTNFVQGWASDLYGSNGGPNNNTNYISALDLFGNGTGNFNNYFVFDISTLTSPITSAVLHVYSADIGGSGTYHLLDASRLAGQLYNTSVLDSSLYTALGQGSPIGNYALNVADAQQWIDIAFNNAGLAALNNSIGNGATTFAVSGTLGPVAPAPLAGTGMLAALAAVIALMVTRSGTLVRNLMRLRKPGMA